MKPEAQPAAEIVVAEWTWKTSAMRAMTAAILGLALERGTHGEFSAMDLQLRGELAQGGAGIAGSVFRQLADAGILAPVGAFVGGEFLQKRVRNAGGNPIGLWALKSRGLAAELFRRAGGAVRTAEQGQLFEV